MDVESYKLASSTDTSFRSGVEVSLGELMRCRPPKVDSGFAPHGKVKTHRIGTKLSLFKGQGMEFDESRPYQSGDDVRTIDWRVTARTGSLYSKQYQEERERPVCLIVDLRETMRFGTRSQFKSVLAAKLAAKLGWVALDGGDRVGGVVLGGEPAIQNFPISGRRSSFSRFLNAISTASILRSVKRQECSLADGVERVVAGTRPGTLVFLMSDYTDVDDYTALKIRRLAEHTHFTHLFIHDPFETSLPDNAYGRVSDGDAVLSLSALSPKAIRAYRDRFNARAKQVENLARLCRGPMHWVSTDKGLDHVLWPGVHHQRKAA